MFSLGLSPIPEKSIQHEMVNQTAVRLTWPKHSFSAQVGLRNIETNFSASPTKHDQISALFTNLTEASIYRVEFYISKENYTPINQTTEHIIRTGEYFPISPKKKQIVL